MLIGVCLLLINSTLRGLRCIFHGEIWSVCQLFCAKPAPNHTIEISNVLVQIVTSKFIRLVRKTKNEPRQYYSSFWKV